METTYTQTAVSGRAIRTATAAIRHDGFHGAVGVFDRLRAVRMRNELGRRRAVRVLALRGRGATLGRLGGNLPLRDASGELDVVVLPAGAVPLGDPAGRKLRGTKVGAFGARGDWAGHGVRRRAVDAQKGVSRE